MGSSGTGKASGISACIKLKVSVLNEPSLSC